MLVFDPDRYVPKADYVHPAVLSEGVQEYFETYIPQFCKPESKVKFFFDVYDVEEGVL